MYSKTTQHIKVTAQPVFMEHQSEPTHNQYFWAYHIAIENTGDKAVKLHWRDWKIIDTNGLIESVSGSGIVGESPLIQPGQTIRYTSGTPLKTPSGMMMGQYLMENEDGENFAVEIPAFSLDSPYQSIKYQ